MRYAFFISVTSSVLKDISKKQGFAFGIYFTSFVFKNILKDEEKHLRFAFVIYVTSFGIKDI